MATEWHAGKYSQKHRELVTSKIRVPSMFSQYVRFRNTRTVAIDSVQIWPERLLRFVRVVFNSNRRTINNRGPRVIIRPRRVIVKCRKIRLRTVGVNYNNLSYSLAHRSTVGTRIPKSSEPNIISRGVLKIRCVCTFTPPSRRVCTYVTISHVVVIILTSVF